MAKLEEGPYTESSDGKICSDLSLMAIAYDNMHREEPHKSSAYLMRAGANRIKKLLDECERLRDQISASHMGHMMINEDCKFCMGDNVHPGGT